MSDDFGLSALVGSPILERVGPEERLDRNLPRRPKHQNGKAARKDSGNDSPEVTQEIDDSTSSQHIDLRV